MTYDMRTGTYHKATRASAISALGNLKKGDKRIQSTMREMYVESLYWADLTTYFHSTPVPTSPPKLRIVA